MSEFRKKWSWPAGLAEKVYFIIRKWDNQYERTGKIHKSKRIPHERYGEETPKTQVIMRVHTLAFTYPEIKWLSEILNTEDPNTTQSRIFSKAVEVFEKKQISGRAPAGISLPFDLAFTKDEVTYVHNLLQWIGIRRRQTPSELKMQVELDKKGLTSGEW